MRAQCYVYIVANTWRTLYVGTTSNLGQRMTQQKNRTFHGFTSRYEVDRLVYFEQLPSRSAAEKREQQIKSWRRARKIELIDGFNPEWKDLADAFPLLRK